MSEHIRQVREVQRSGNTTRTTEVTDSHNPAAEHVAAQFTAVRAVWFIAGVLLVVLTLRFLLALLGANPNNAFASFIYNISYPFVAPFFGIFSFNYQYGVSTFESYTLVAIVIYALVAWGIARLLTLNQPTD